MYLSALTVAAAAHAVDLPYEADPYGWPMAYIDESYPEAGIIGGFAGGGFDPGAVVNGDRAPEGKWPDAAGIVFQGQYVGCSGTLIANNVVLTAGHCVGGITHVILDSVDWYRDGGEIIEVEKTVEYPNSWRTYDIAVLKLKEKTSIPPRRIALDCLLDEYLQDGAEVAVVGFGSTSERGGGNNTALNEGITYVQDADCDQSYIDGIRSGCNGSVSPGGEIGAGGNNVDACYGDSGGPLYLLTPEGEFLVGVTSRAYAGVSSRYPCRDGGIYVRPDAVFDWIQDAADRKIPAYNCNAAPELVHADDIVTRAGQSGFTVVEMVDDGEDFTLELVEPPAHGEVVLHKDGQIEYIPRAGFVGEDAFVVAVTDDGHPLYERSKPHTVDLPIEVLVQSALPGVGSSDGASSLTADGMVGCGCNAGGSPLAAGWLVGLVALLGLRRRR